MSLAYLTRINTLVPSNLTIMKKIYSLFILLSLYCISTNAQITGMSPNSGLVSLQNLTTTITSNNQFVVTATQSGNLNEAYLYKGASRIDLFDVLSWNFNATVTHPDTCIITSFNIPVNADTGLYNLVVKTQDQFAQIDFIDTLPAAFTVLPGDALIQGNIYEDINLNKIRDAGEPKITGANAGLTQINGFHQYYGVDANGNYSIPVMNGTYTIDWTSSNERFFLSTDSNTYTVNVNNANVTGLNFGLYRGLTGIAPVQSVAGRTVNFTVTSRHLFTGTGMGNISYAAIGSYFAQSINVIDSNTVTFSVNFPSNATPALYDLRISISSGGTHFLRQCFTIAPYDAFLQGNVYYDANGNGLRDTLEAPLPYQRISVVPDSGYGFSGGTGEYSIGVLNGNHTVAWNPLLPATFQLSSDSASFTVNNTGNVTGLDFGLTTTNPDYTCDVSLTANFPRCNSNVWYYLTYQNKSNIPFNGTAYFIKDPNTTYYWSPVTPSGFSGDTIFWTFTNLQPFTPVTIRITISVPGSGTMNYKAGMISVDGSGNVQFTDQETGTQLIRCAFDPNDKSVTPEGVGPEHYTLIGDWLEYLVRFQNTGTDTAFNVTIYDHLSGDLDLSTFELLASSHPVTTEIKQNGQAIYTFANILLPDSNVDEMNSHGYIKYRIKANSTTADFTTIENTAFIVFDANAPIVTNTTNNLMVYMIPVGLSEMVKASGQAIVYPNPFTETAILVFKNENHSIVRLEIRNALGQLMRSDKSTGEEFIIRKNNLTTGVYFYRLLNEDGSENGAGKMIIK